MNASENQTPEARTFNETGKIWAPTFVLVAFVNLGTFLLVTTASIALFALIPLIPVILVLRFIQELGWGLSSTATSTICADELPPRRFAEGMGYFSLTTSLASAVAPALAVALLSRGWDSGPRWGHSKRWR